MDAAGLSLGLLGTALLLGLRHGIDWDHIAAITDVAATQDDPRAGFRLGTVYVLGHAVVVFVLGLVVITVGGVVPDWLDQAMGRIVGWTLLVLGAYVIFTLIRDRGEFRMRSRWMLLFAGVRRARTMLKARLARPAPAVTHDHVHAAVSELHHAGDDVATGPDDPGSRMRAPTHRHRHSHSGPDPSYTTGSVAAIGMLHGVGAETPTQLVVFLAAAEAGGIGTGIAVLLVFLVGLAASNSVITVASTLGFATSTRKLQLVLGGATAVLSLVVGTLFVMGADGTLPVFFAG